jgi:hypothetical protein
VRSIIIGLFVFCISFGAFAQRDSLVVVGDSIKANVSDTTRGARLKKASRNFFSTSRKIFGVDTLTERERPRIIFFRSMLVPGLGQAMNRDYWKLPIVYGAAAGGLYAIHSNSERYNYYLKHVEILTVENKPSMPPLDLPNGVAISKETYARAASQFKRYRDLSIIGFALGWTLFAVEANVRAHLKNFDISDDISFRPALIPLGGTYAAGASITINFK